MTKNASQGSINQQIFPLIPERFLSELPEPPLSIIATTRAARILVAEDNVVNQKVVRGALTRLGHLITIVNNGAEAVAASRESRFDLILMDCQMPVMDGFEATREIRRLEQSSQIRIPIVALTADAMQGTDELCRAAGMDAYLTKPLDLAKLRETLARLLEGVADDSLLDMKKAATER